MRRYEKIFQAEPGILKILNISNAEEIYIETALSVEFCQENKNEDLIKLARKKFQQTKAIYVEMQFYFTFSIDKERTTNEILNFLMKDIRYFHDFCYCAPTITLGPHMFKKINATITIQACLCSLLNVNGCLQSTDAGPTVYIKSDDFKFFI